MKLSFRVDPAPGFFAGPPKAITLIPPLREILSFDAYTCGSSGLPEWIRIPVYHAVAEFPDSELDAIFLTGDLQFYDRRDVPEGDRRLMGLVVAEELLNLSLAKMIPAAAQIGIVLTGDFYAIPSLAKRGGLGDVTPIWEAFADVFRWVVGVAGNHDAFEGETVFPARLLNRENTFPLNGPSDLLELDSLWIGGISGIIGNPRKAWRHTGDELVEQADLLLAEALDLFILHEGPRGSERAMRGCETVNMVLERAAQLPAITVFGHCHWPQPLDQSLGTLLNTDACAVLLTRPGAPMHL